LKATSEKLLDEIADNFNQFLLSGKLDIKSFAQKSQPNLNIDNIRKLLRIHFILTESKDTENPGVIDFMRNLNQRIRRIKTAVTHKKSRFEGEVRGRICWKSTIDMRCSEMPFDKINFICHERERNFNIPENLVLKKFLSIINDILKKDLGNADAGYGWLSEWFKDNKSLKKSLEDIFYRNIYIRKVELEQEEITPRMIANVKKSRKPLYREAACLLERYDKLMNYEFDANEAKELLRNTFIKPEKTEVLFELYWAITIVNSFKDNSENFSFQLIEPNQNIVAKWISGGKRYRLFHNATGSFKFHEDLDKHCDSEKDDNFITREIKVLKTLSELVKRSFENTLWGGRPDIILEQYNIEDDKYLRPEAILIGEVKYTDNLDYAVQGFRELLEYIALIKENNDKDDYIIEKDKLFNSLDKNPIPISGILFTDKIEGLSFTNEVAPNLILQQYGDDILSENYSI